MGKHHLMRIAVPKTWQVARKGAKFITKPVAGPHSLANGMPVSVLLKEVLQYAGTTRDAKKILNASEVKIDGRVVKDFRLPIGLFDTIEFGSIKEHFRVLLNRKGRLCLARISREEALTKPCKIIGKTMVKGRLQLNLYDGRNILADSHTYKVGDTVLLSLPEQKISKHFKLGKKSSVLLTGGRHIGETGNVEDISQNMIVYKDKEGNMIETSRKYAFVVGDSTPSITLA